MKYLFCSDVESLAEVDPRDLEDLKADRVVTMMQRWQIILLITIILRKKILTDLHTMVPSQALLGFVQIFLHFSFN